LFGVLPLFAADPPTAPPPRPVRFDAAGDRLPPGAVARLGTTRYRVGRYWARTDLSPDAGTIYAWNSTGVVTLDAATGRRLWALADIRHGDGLGPFGAVRGDRVVVADRAGVRVHDRAAGRVVADYTGPPFAPGKHVELNDVLVSSDGRRVVFGHNSPLPGGGPGRVWVLDLDTLTARAFEVDPYRRTWGVLSPDGATLVTGGEVNPRPGTAGIQSWDAKTGREKWRLAGQRLTSATFTPDGRRLVGVWYAAPAGLILDAATGEEVGALDGVTDWPGAFAFSPDGRRVYAAVGTDAGVREWDAATGRTVARHPPPVMPNDRGFFGVHVIRFRPDGSPVALGSWGCVVFPWDVRTGRPLSPVRGSFEQIHALHFDPDGRTLSAAGYTYHVARWDVATGRPLDPAPLPFPRRDEVNRSLQPGEWAFSRDGRVVVVPDWKHHTSTVAFDLRSGKQVGKFLVEGRAYGSRHHALSPDGAWVAVGGDFEEWSADGKRLAPRATLFEVVTGKRRELPVPVLGPAAFAFAPGGGKLLVVTGGAGRAGTTRVVGWDLAADREVGAGTIIGWERVRFRQTPAVSPYGRTAVIPGYRGPGPEWRPYLCVWDVTAGKELGAIDLPPGSYDLPVAFAPDGRAFAVGAVDEAGEPVVRVYDAAGLRLRAQFRGHLGPIRAVAFSPDGRTLASGGDDTTVLLWELPRP
jgi:WD40 repeat protein